MSAVHEGEHVLLDDYVCNRTTDSQAARYGSTTEAPPARLTRTTSDTSTSPSSIRARSRKSFGGSTNEETLFANEQVGPRTMTVDAATLSHLRRQTAPTPALASRRRETKAKAKTRFTKAEFDDRKARVLAWPGSN